MNQSATQTMRFLIMDTSENTSEEFINLLGEKGVGASAHRVSGKAKLIEELKNNSWDFILLNEEVKDIDANECFHCIKEYKQETALLLLTSGQIDVDKMTEAYGIGVSALVSLSFIDYSVMTIIKEFSALQDRSAKNKLLQDNVELEERCQLLLSSSKEAVAYIHQGIHVYANEAYLEKFKFSDLDDAICTPFIDVVKKEDRKKLKDFLSVIQTKYDEERLNTADTMELDIMGQCLDSSAFDAQLLFKSTQYDGENCLQVFVNEKVAEAVANIEPPLLIVESSPSNISNITDSEKKKEPDLSKDDVLVSVEYEPIIAVDDIDVRFYDVTPVFNDKAAGISKLDQWGIENTVNILKKQLSQGQSARAIYTATGSSIRDKNFAAWLANLLKTNGLSADAITISLSQSDIVEFKEEVTVLINSLHENNIKVCVGDFADEEDMVDFVGEKNIEFVKFSNETYDQYIADKESWTGLSDIIKGLHENKVEIVASNIQSSSILSAFWSIGVDMVQGEYFQKGAMEFKEEAFVAQIAL